MPVASHGGLGTCVFDWTIRVENLGRLWQLTEPSVNKVYGLTLGNLMPVPDWTVTFAVLALVEFDVSLIVQSFAVLFVQQFLLDKIAQIWMSSSVQVCFVFWEIVSSSREVGTDTSDTVGTDTVLLACLSVVTLPQLPGKCLAIELWVCFRLFLGYKGQKLLLHGGPECLQD